VIISLISIYLAIGFGLWLINVPANIRDIKRRADKYRFGFIERVAFHGYLHVLCLIIMLTAWPRVLWILRKP